MALMRNRWRWMSAISWVAIATPLAYHLSFGELRPAAQYETARERIESLHWNDRAFVPGRALAPEAYLLAYASERERYNDQHVLRLWLPAVFVAAVTGGSLPFLLWVFRYRRHTSPDSSV